MAKINSVAYSNFIRLRQEQEQVSTVFMFLGFSETGNLTYLDKADTISLVSGSSSIPFFPEDVNDGWRKSAAAYLPKVKSDHENCISNPVLNPNRLKRILPGVDSDRVVICPISFGDRAIGFVSVFWKFDEKKPASELEIKASAKLYADLTEDYILKQKIFIQN